MQFRCADLTEQPIISFGMKLDTGYIIPGK